MAETFSATNLGAFPGRLALRSREAAQALGISERLLWTMTQQGKVPHTRVSKGVIVYPIDALRRWLDEQASISHISLPENH